MPQPFTPQNTQQQDFTQETFTKIELLKKFSNNTLPNYSLCFTNINNTSIIFIHQEHEKLECYKTKENNTREKNCEQNALHTTNNSKQKQIKNAAEHHLTKDPPFLRPTLPHLLLVLKPIHIQNTLPPKIPKNLNPITPKINKQIIHIHLQHHHAIPTDIPHKKTRKLF